METKAKKKKYYLIKFVILLTVVLGVIVYSASFPATMRLLDEASGDIISLFGGNKEITVFSDFSDFSGKALEKAGIFFDTIKNSIENIEQEKKKVSPVIFSCAAIFPSEGNVITSKFGERQDPFSGEKDFHSGIDIAAPPGSGIFAAWPGIIYETGYNKTDGKYIIIKHSDEFFTKYCHLSDINVKRNDFINAGEQIGKAGSSGRSTGSHLHFEVGVDGRKTDPMECFDI